MSHGLHIFFHVDVAAAKSTLGLGRDLKERLAEFSGVKNYLDSLTTTTVDGFEDHWVANFFRQCCG